MSSATPGPAVSDDSSQFLSSIAAHAGRQKQMRSIRSQLSPTLCAHAGMPPKAGFIRCQLERDRQHLLALVPQTGNRNPGERMICVPDHPCQPVCRLKRWMGTSRGGSGLGLACTVGAAAGRTACARYLGGALGPVCPRQEESATAACGEQASAQPPPQSSDAQPGPAAGYRSKEGRPSPHAAHTAAWSAQAWRVSTDSAAPWCRGKGTVSDSWIKAHLRPTTQKPTRFKAATRPCRPMPLPSIQRSGVVEEEWAEPSPDSDASGVATFMTLDPSHP
jgi:hypothetical protein